MSVRFELENVDGYDADYHHDAILTQLENNNPRSFAMEMLRSVGELVQRPETWIEACKGHKDVEIEHGWNLIPCDDHPECESTDHPQSITDGNLGNCGCHMSHDFESVYLHANLVVLDGYEVEITFDTKYQDCKAELRYGKYDKSVVIDSDTIAELHNHYQEAFESFR